MSAEDDLVEAAKAARLKAHAPYSNFLVGCAIESEDGQIAIGANMENACYRLGVCAEQSALAAALQAFGLDKIKRIAIVGGPRADAPDTGEPVTPCGGCRQAIAEAARLAHSDVAVICCDATGTSRWPTTIEALLPASFDLD